MTDVSLVCECIPKMGYCSPAAPLTWDGLEDTREGEILPKGRAYSVELDQC
jgi:hypothetical protein